MIYYIFILSKSFSDHLHPVNLFVTFRYRHLLRAHNAGPPMCGDKVLITTRQSLEKWEK